MGQWRDAATRGCLLLRETSLATQGVRRTRDGVTPIDLIDGNSLAEKLKELELGIKTEMVEEVSIDKEWFKGI